MKTGHEHEYRPHKTWPTHYTCRVCGFSIVRYIIDKMHKDHVVVDWDGDYTIQQEAKG